MGAGCACISLVLVGICGACGEVWLAGLVVDMRVGVLHLSRSSWLGLAVPVRVLVWTSASPSWPGLCVVCVYGGPLRTPPFLTWSCGVWSGSGSPWCPPVLGDSNSPAGDSLAGVCSVPVWGGWFLTGPGGLPCLAWCSLPDHGGCPSLPLSRGVASCGGRSFGSRRGCCFPPFFLLLPGLPSGGLSSSAGGGVLRLWLSVLFCCGPLVATVAFSDCPPLPPPFFLGPTPLLAVLAVSASPWLVVCLFLGGGLCWPIWLGLSRGPSVAVWPLWFAFSGCGLSSGWVGCSLGVLAVCDMGVAGVLEWLGSCLPWWSGCVASPFCGFPSRPLPPPSMAGSSWWGGEGALAWSGSFPLLRRWRFTPSLLVLF